MARNRRNSDAMTSDLGEAQLKKNRPKDTKLRQQRLPAWQPILTAKTVIPIVFGISILFIPIGIVLLLTSQSVQELIIPYVNDANNFCLNSPQSEICTVQFRLAENFEGDVYFYYGLENYFQNHRRYMKSRSDEQLLGVNLKNTQECTPYTTLGDKPIAPCGAIANSMFNDTFSLYFGPMSQLVPMTHKGLVWPVDLDTKFKNPTCSGRPCQTIDDLCSAFAGTIKPPNWKRDPCRLDMNDVQNSGFQNADFIIWMRTAALQDFRKPYRKLIRDPEVAQTYVNGLPAGNYTLQVQNNYNVSAFSGKKTFIISTTSWIGGKNPFLGIAYIFVGILCAILGVIFIVVHIKYGHTLEEIAGIDQTDLRSRHNHNQ